eukprot:1075061-Pleurochrysis_carterae.AAC.1
MAREGQVALEERKEKRAKCSGTPIVRSSRSRTANDSRPSHGRIQTRPSKQSDDEAYSSARRCLPSANPQRAGEKQLKHHDRLRGTLKQRAQLRGCSKGDDEPSACAASHT